MTLPELPIFYTTAEVAAVLRESGENVSRRCKRGEIKAVRPGRKYLISQAALDEFLTPAPTTEHTGPPVFLTAIHKRDLAAQVEPPYLTTKQRERERIRRACIEEGLLDENDLFDFDDIRIFTV
ncbi:helix-turn-helix domain-containing protein [Aeromicrobium fastidiosum]|nr:helix-turn-helix domain-containing protein [Aeromicrobium fastidiosum]MBP2389373.1 excisionase family DNA binding protein [Aeromicrobium fastidiosum]